MAKRTNQPSKPMEPYLGDVADMVRDPEPFVLRKPAPDYHWAKRGAVVIVGVLVVWYGLIWWAIG